MLEFLLSSVLMQINTAKYAEVTHTEPQIKELRKQAKVTVKLIIDKLHKRVVDQESISPDLINLSNSLNSDSIGKLKKIFIFLRESEENNDGIDIHHTIQLLKQLLIRVWSLIPKAI